MTAQPVDGTGAVVGEIAPVNHEDLGFGDQLVPGPQGLQVPADPGLVDDDRRVLGIGLVFTPVALGCPVDGHVGDVERVLAVVE